MLTCTRARRTKALLGLSCLLRHSRPCVQAFQEAQGPSTLARFTVGLASARCPASQGLPEGSVGPSEGRASSPEKINSRGLGGGADGGEQLRQLRKGLQLLTYLVKEVGALAWSGSVCDWQGQCDVQLGLELHGQQRRGCMFKLAAGHQRAWLQVADSPAATARCRTAGRSCTPLIHPGTSGSVGGGTRVVQG